MNGFALTGMGLVTGSLFTHPSRILTSSFQKHTCKSLSLVSLFVDENSAEQRRELRKQIAQTHPKWVRGWGHIFLCLAPYLSLFTSVAESSTVDRVEDCLAQGELGRRDPPTILLFPRIQSIPAGILSLAYKM
jgi:hypothetical protein